MRTKKDYIKRNPLWGICRRHYLLIAIKRNSLREILRRSFLLIISSFFISCNNDVPVIEVPQAKSSNEPDLIKTNRMLAQKENTEIENFAARRNWTMTDIGSGIKVMVTKEGHGPVADYNDTVMFRYTVRNIEDKVVYENVNDTVIIGRLKPNRGIDFALRTLNKGASATVILPSEEAYGVPGDGDRIGKRWILIYNLEINNIDKLK